MIDPMVRAVAAVSFLTLLAQGSPACAQDAPGERDEARYSFNKVDDGYLRLDGRTGQVSLCTRRPAGWACQAVADDRTALEAEIARLQGENAALKKDMLARNLPLPGTVKPEPPRLQLPSDADLNRMMAFLDKMWRRLVEMIAAWRKDVLDKS